MKELMEKFHLFQWVNYKNGDTSSELNIDYGQYKIQYTKDEHASYSKIYTFSENFVNMFLVAFDPANTNLAII